jgi:hypothetical protein
VLGGIPAPVAAALVARYLLLGPSDGPLNELRLKDPLAARLFSTEVEIATDGAIQRYVGAHGARPADGPWVGEAIALLERIEATVAARLSSSSSRGAEVVRFLEWVGGCVKAFIEDPYDPFLQVVETAIAAAGRLYAPAGLTAGDLTSRVSAGLGWTRRAPGQRSFAGGISAVTTTRPDGVTRVVLHACPAAFGRDCALVVPYLVFHEYICHAARFVAGGPPPPTSTSTLFTEGWMDYVACGVHHHTAERAARAPRAWLSPQGNRDCAWRLAELLRAPHVASGRAVGWAAARLLDEELGDRTAAWRPLWDLSARLNRSAIPDEDLDAFALAVHRLLAQRLPAPATRLLAIVHDRDRPPWQLVSSVCTLAGG